MTSFDVGADDLVATVRTDRGPRVVALRCGGGPNLFAELGDLSLDGPHGPYTFLGGHRLWTAPEEPDRTYRPDDRPCRLDTDGTVTGPDDGSGLERSIHLAPEASSLVVHHTVRNVGTEAVTVAPWAITQLPPGGVALLPLGPPAGGPTASHALVLWPYSRLDDPRVSVAGDHVRIASNGATTPLKLGSAPGTGRVGYLRGGHLFVKQAAVPAAVPDLGAASQVYVGHGFVELETLGPVSVLEPGDTVGHVERWTVTEVDDVDEATATVGAAP